MKSRINHCNMNDFTKKQLCDGLGLRNPLYWMLSLGGAYLGGSLQARKQFINGGDFFRNAKFD